jgi:hypothetical protein
METIVMRFGRPTALTGFARRLARLARGFANERKRRRAQDEQFYRDLRAFSLANNLPPVCEDDWRVGAESKLGKISPHSLSTANPSRSTPTGFGFV